jgi:hypothetical protein
MEQPNSNEDGIGQRDINRVDDDDDDDDGNNSREAGCC